MTQRFFTPVEVESEMLRLSQVLEDSTEELAGKAEIAARADAEWKREWAKAYLRAEGTQKAREATADEQTAEAYLNRETSEAVSRSLREKLYSVRAQLDVLRSINSNVRAQT